jgi:hypothetical protein
MKSTSLLKAFASEIPCRRHCEWQSTIGARKHQRLKEESRPRQRLVDLPAARATPGSKK